MKKVFLLVVVILLMSWGQAFADYSFNLSFTSSDASIMASGTLFTASNGAGPLPVTGGSITGYFGGGADTFTATLYPSTGYNYSPAGVFIYDNQLSPGSSQPISYWGLLFTTGTLGNSNYREINLFSDGSTQNDYRLVQWTQTAGYTDYTSSNSKGASTVPIPGAILLFAPGLAGIALLRRRNKE